MVRQSIEDVVCNSYNLLCTNNKASNVKSMQTHTCTSFGFLRLFMLKLCRQNRITDWYHFVPNHSISLEWAAINFREYGNTIHFPYSVGRAMNATKIFTIFIGLATLFGKWTLTKIDSWAQVRFDSLMLGCVFGSFPDLMEYNNVRRFRSVGEAKHTWSCFFSGIRSTISQCYRYFIHK